MCGWTIDFHEVSGVVCEWATVLLATVNIITTVKRYSERVLCPLFCVCRLCVDERSIFSKCPVSSVSGPVFFSRPLILLKPLNAILNVSGVRFLVSVVRVEEWDNSQRCNAMVKLSGVVCVWINVSIAQPKYLLLGLQCGNADSLDCKYGCSGSRSR